MTAVLTKEALSHGYFLADRYKYLITFKDNRSIKHMDVMTPVCPDTLIGQEDSLIRFKFSPSSMTRQTNNKPNPLFV